jgi:superfamily I DNA/RNA helicase
VQIVIKYNIAYIICGGFRFYERAEIKEALAYLRLIENSADGVAFERVVQLFQISLSAWCRLACAQSIE